MSYHATITVGENVIPLESAESKEIFFVLGSSPISKQGEEARKNLLKSNLGKLPDTCTVDAYHREGSGKEETTLSHLRTTGVVLKALAVAEVEVVIKVASTRGRKAEETSRTDFANLPVEA